MRKRNISSGFLTWFKHKTRKKWWESRSKTKPDFIKKTCFTYRIHRRRYRNVFLEFHLIFSFPCEISRVTICDVLCHEILLNCSFSRFIAIEHSVQVKVHRDIMIQDQWWRESVLRGNISSLMVTRVVWLSDAISSDGEDFQVYVLTSVDLWKSSENGTRKLIQLINVPRLSSSHIRLVFSTIFSLSNVFSFPISFSFLSKMITLRFLIKIAHLTTCSFCKKNTKNNLVPRLEHFPVVLIWEKRK